MSRLWLLWYETRVVLMMSRLVLYSYIVVGAWSLCLACVWAARGAHSSPAWAIMGMDSTHDTMPILKAWYCAAAWA